MPTKAHVPHSSHLYRELRHIESRGLSINYSAMERQVYAINHASSDEQTMLKNHSTAFLKVLSHV